MFSIAFFILALLAFATGFLKSGFAFFDAFIALFYIICMGLSCLSFIGAIFETSVLSRDKENRSQAWINVILLSAGIIMLLFSLFLS